MPDIRRDFKIVKNPENMSIVSIVFVGFFLKIGKFQTSQKKCYRLPPSHPRAADPGAGLHAEGAPVRHGAATPGSKQGVHSGILSPQLVLFPG